MKPHSTRDYLKKYELKNESVFLGKGFLRSLLVCLLILCASVRGKEVDDKYQQSKIMQEEPNDPEEKSDMRETENGNQIVTETKKKDEPEVFGFFSLLPEQIKVSGSIRYRLENQHNFDFDDNKDKDQEFDLLRTRLNFDVNMTESLRAFIQLQDSRIFGEEPTSTTNTGHIDFHQSYFEAKNIGGSRVGIRFGRQEMAYGKMRLIGNPNWRTNVGRSFDGITLWHDSDKLRTNFFAAKYDPPKGKDQELGGVYLSFKSIPSSTLDSYFLIKLNRHEEENIGESGETGDLKVYTIGARLEGKRGSFDYEVEAAHQFGEHATDSIRAWAASFVAGYTFDSSIHPRIGLEYNIASGDSDPHDGKYETFDQLYPANHFMYGYMDLVGFRNLRNLRFTIDTRPVPRLRLGLDYHLFWVDEMNDSLYNLSGAVSRRGTAGADDEIGQEIDFTIWHDINKELKLMAGYSHFFAGGFLNDTGRGDDADWVFVQLLFEF